MNRRLLLTGFAITGICALVSAAVIAWTSDSLDLAGSTPATIWGADLSQLSIDIFVTAPIVAVALTKGYARVGAALVWLGALAVLTHRVVDGGSDGLADIWLGLPIGHYRAAAETDPDPRGCHVGPFGALCIVRSGESHTIFTGVRFARLDETDGKLAPVR